MRHCAAARLRTVCSVCLRIQSDSFQRLGRRCSTRTCVYHAMQKQLRLVGAHVDTLHDIMGYWAPTSDPSQLDSCSLFRWLALCGVGGRSFGSSISVYGATSNDAWPLWDSTAQRVVQLTCVAITGSWVRGKHWQSQLACRKLVQANRL